MARHLRERKSVTIFDRSVYIHMIGPLEVKRLPHEKNRDVMKINPDLKILLSSGCGIDSEAKEILARGCDAFIQKPFTMEELSQGIKAVLD